MKSAFSYKHFLELCKLVVAINNYKRSPLLHISPWVHSLVFWVKSMAVVGVIVKSATWLPSWIFMLILELERKVKGQFTAIDVDSAKLSLQNESALILRIPAESWNCFLTCEICHCSGKKCCLSLPVCTKQTTSLKAKSSVVCMKP